MAEHYETAIIPARVRKSKDKPNAEGSVGSISTWITAALGNEQFFSLAELNVDIRKKLDASNVKMKVTDADMLEAGIVDPAKVVRIALENASSIASMVLTTESLVVNIKEAEQAMLAGNPGMY